MKIDIFLCVVNARFVMSCQEIIIYCAMTEQVIIRNDIIHAGTSRMNISAALIY